MKKLIVHIGYPKTATTSLQLNLFSSLGKEGKIEYLNHLNRNDSYLGNVYCKNVINYITGNGQIDKCKSELKKIASLNNNISLISNENLSIFYQDFTWVKMNSNAFNSAKRIKTVFAPYFDKIEIVMTLRAQVTLVPSFYAQIYRYISPIDRGTTLSQWIGDNFNSTIADEKMLFNFDFIYSSYCLSFGEDMVKVLIYEDLKNDKIFFYKQLAYILNIPSKTLEKTLTNSVKNKTLTLADNNLITEPASLNDSVHKYFRLPLKRVLPVRLFKLSRDFYRNTLGLILSQCKVSKKIIVKGLSNDEKYFILMRFNKSNLALAKKIDLDLAKLKKYGYLDL